MSEKMNNNHNDDDEFNEEQDPSANENQQLKDNEDNNSEEDFFEQFEKAVSSIKKSSEEDKQHQTVNTATIGEIDLKIDKKKYAELLDRYQRLLAEFDNYRKRTAKEKSSTYNDAVCDTVSKILPIADNLNRALFSVEDKENEVYKGVEMIFKQLMHIFNDIGIEEIETIGEQFNPNLHYAVSSISKEECEDDENTIIEELQKGYIINNKVIRPAMVKIVN